MAVSVVDMSSELISLDSTEKAPHQLKQHPNTLISPSSQGIAA